MLRMSTGRLCAGLRAPKLARFAHGEAYGPAEPLGPYLKWLGAISVVIGLVTYDRFYSDRAVTKLVTPGSFAEEIAQNRDKVIDAMLRQQEEAAVLLAPRKPRPILDNVKTMPVPAGPPRGEHTPGVLDVSQLGERRPRSDVMSRE